jgi:hypothetical protein
MIMAACPGSTPAMNAAPYHNDPHLQTRLTDA